MKQLLLSILLSAGVLAGAAAPWMSELPDGMKVRQMSIPGAHDAAAKDLSGLLAQGKCQSKTLAELWDAGVRAFDLRVKKDGNIYHGSNKTNVTLVSAFTTFKEKLAADSEDFAVVFLVDEGNEGADWISYIDGFLPDYDNIIAQFNPEMTIADAHGKIIIVTRNDVGNNGTIAYRKAGIADGWGSNNPNKDGTIKTCGSSTTTPTKIQDHYDNVSNSTKVSEISAMLDWSIANHFSKTWVFNFASGYNSSIGTDSAIKANAKAANKGAYEYLIAKPAGRTGIVFMDYAGDDSNSYYGASLVNALIARNSVEVPLSNDEMITFFNNKSNWSYGAGATGLGTTVQKDATMVESYQDAGFRTGVVMTASCDGIANGDYMVNIAAHANWTPGRGSIQTAKVADGTIGCTVLKINGSSVDLPINHNTGLPNPMGFYSIPVSVTDGTMTITFDNVRAGANWFTSYVQSVYPLKEGETVMYHDFQNNFMGWNSTTGADNQGRKGGSSELSSTTCWENWHGSPYTGKMYCRNVVPNGRYRVSLDVTSRTVDGDNIYFYANDERSSLTTTSQEHHSAEIDVTDNVIEYGLKFDTPKANWAGVDNARIELLSLADADGFTHSLGNAAHHFKAAHNWQKGEAFLGGNLQYKDDIYVETWRSSTGERPEGEVIYSTAGNIANGNYLMGLYAFSCNTAGAEYPDGDMTHASISANNKEYFIPTYNTGSVPSLHEFYWLPVSVTDGTLRVGINGYGYPNWFGIDMVSLIPMDNGEDVTLPLQGPINNYGHGKNMFASEMNTTIYSNAIKMTDNNYSPDEPMYENWNGSAYTGRFVSRIYVPEGEYEMGLDCFAQKIHDNLNDYYMFANDVRTPKTESDAFETLKAKVKVGKSSGKMRAAAAVETLYPIEYGFGIDSASTQWTGIKNPTMVRLADTPTSVEEIETEESADEHIYTIMGICVGESETALRSLPAGIYIYKGRKIMLK